MPKSIIISADAKAPLLATPIQSQDHGTNFHMPSKDHKVLKVAPTNTDKAVKGPPMNQRPAPDKGRSIGTSVHPHLDVAKHRHPEQSYINQTKAERWAEPTENRGIASPDHWHNKDSDH